VKKTDSGARSNSRKTSKAPWPTFKADSVALDYRRLKYNPCDDLIFPTIVRAGDYLSRPLAAYYLYYAPHNAPGGVCLATAPSLNGPWTEYDHNPLISNVWPPHYQVEHISSPHVIWIAEESRFFMFYHGDNDTTRYASSVDGIHFRYEGIAVCAKDLAESEAAFYARVFRHPISRGQDGYVMLFVSYHTRHHGLYVARSKDARAWRIDEKPLLAGPAVEGARYIWSPYLARYGKRWLMAYHVDFFESSQEDQRPATDLYASEVNEALTECGSPRLLCSRELFGADNRRISDPCLITENNQLYLFCTVGPRLDQKIALAREVGAE
jgi:hypothetical protein